MRLRLLAAAAMALVTGACATTTQVPAGHASPAGSTRTSQPAPCTGPSNNASPNGANGFVAYDMAQRYALAVTFQGNFQPGVPMPLDTWKSSDCGWVHLADADPRLEGAAAMAFDPGLRETVVVGKQTLGWNGSAWQVLTPSSPLPQLHGSVYMAFDEVRSLMVLVVELDTSMSTWTFDGKAWTRVSITGPVEFGASFAYDPRMKKILLFGGFSPPQESNTVTWAWDGATWTQLHPASSPPTGGSAMAFDIATQQMILLNQNQQTWSWDTITWARLAIQSAPMYPNPQLIYDSERKVLELAEAGSTGSGTETWVYDGAWALSLQAPTTSQARSTPSPAGGTGTFTPPPAPAPSTNPAAALPYGAICRFPYSDISEASGGFIYYPGGQRESDPRAAVALPGSTPGAVGVNPGLAWLPAQKIWLPVPLRWVAPDRAFYVYLTKGEIRGASVTDGAAGTIISGDWRLLGVADTGVYLSKIGVPGAWWLPFGGTPAQIIDHDTWQTDGDGALWGVDASSNLIRHDLRTNVETNFHQINSYTSSVAGFDNAGNPVVWGSGRLAVYLADGTRIHVWDTPNGAAAEGYVFSDPSGELVFEVGGSGIVTWTQAGGVKQLSAAEANLMGPCGP